jgi:Uma2 family endonuclease
MRATIEPPMTVDQYCVWLEEQAAGERYELIDGRPVAMSPERVGHARAKNRVCRALERAIQVAGLPCEALPDGVAVKVDEITVYEPDVMVHCGEPLDPDLVMVEVPLIVVEVVSPSSGRVDAGAKLDGYFSIPSVQHYLLIKTDRPTIIHHRRAGDEIATRIVQEGELVLDPPGLRLAVADVSG